MRKLRILTGFLGAMAVIYLADGIVLHFRHDPFGSVEVERYDVIPEKNGRTEFAFEEPVNLKCAHALFPHFGYEPCWYLSRHSEQRINY